MSIKTIYKKTAVILLAIAILFIAVPLTVFAAPDIDIIYAANASADAGDTINVTVSTTGGASISTLGLRLYYDKEKLVYQGSQWAESLQNSNSSMTLVSDVVYNGSQVLNISMIADGGYQSGSALITIAFAVKEGYTENPFRLELREITDENLQSVESATTIVYQNTGNESGEGTGSAGTGTDSSNENTGSSGSSTNVPTSSTNNTNANETAVAAPAVSSTDNITAVNAINTATIADTAMKDNHANAESIVNTASTETTSTAANHPKTFQTGVEDFGTNLLLLGAVFGLAGIACILIRRKLSR